MLNVLALIYINHVKLVLTDMRKDFDMKMYIAVLDEFPDYMTPTLVAHAVLGYNMKINSTLTTNSIVELYYQWMNYSFKKVVLRVNQKEFDKISALPNVGLFHENSTLGGKKACAVLVVDKDIPNVLKYAKLWEPVKVGGFV